MHRLCTKPSQRACIRSSSIRTLSGSTKAAATRMQKRLLRLTIDPVPVAMADRLSALKVLEQYGAIQMFKKVEVRVVQTLLAALANSNRMAFSML